MTGVSSFRARHRLPVLIVLSLSFSSLSAAEELPLYELGIGAGSYHSPHYLGADQDFSLLLPVPYFVYRGKYVRTDRSGIKTILFDNNRFDLSISLGGGLPVDSEDNRAREGVPDLDLLLLDSDGKFRAVISNTDPGVANWLDASGYQHGHIVGRWKECSSFPKPGVKKVKVDHVRHHLPKDTSMVTPEEREATLRKMRKAAQLRRRW